jgi:prepilin-type N-terminal cleavage/methylation domain-containing protein
MIGVRSQPRDMRESGFTMVEVLVAMMLFTIVSVSIVGSLIAIRTISASANLRQTAQNIAAGALDKARVVGDITTLSGGTSTQTVGSRTFTITQSVSWVGSIIGDDSQCSSGSGNMIARAVSVSVTWNGMGGQNPVTMSTVVAPDARLNTAGNGAILVSVKSASGAGLAGVTANAKPAATNPNGATTTAGPFTTDADGCVFIPGVTPGNYDVTITKAAAGNTYVGSDQTPNTLTDKGITVSASNSASATFQFDQSMKYSLTFGSSIPGRVLPSAPVISPSFTNSYGIWLPSGGPDYYLHPYPVGYRIIAGQLGNDQGTAPTCAALDPSAWEAVVDPNDPTQTWSPPELTQPATAGGSATYDVPMGAVTITGYSGTITAKALSAPADSTDPGCDAATTAPSTAKNYTFTSVPSGATLALPFGYWQLTTDSGTVIPAANLSVDAATNSRIFDDGEGDVRLVLDPRVAGPTPTEPAS